MTPPVRKAAPVKPRDAASLVLVDRRDGEPRVLMGKRHSRMAFAPDAFVFPGGKLDPDDFKVQPATGFSAQAHRLIENDKAARPMAQALAVAAIRETFEETGLLIAAPGDIGTTPGAAWAHFRHMNVAPRLDGLHLAARAITPTISPIRFHARFFVADAHSATGELRGSGELEELGWYTIEEALKLPVIDVTAFVLRGVAEARFVPEARGIPLFGYRGDRPIIHARHRAQA
ncbi:MAG: NUDIX hydrolase [Parvibaculum sp.]